MREDSRTRAGHKHLGCLSDLSLSEEGDPLEVVSLVESTRDAHLYMLFRLPEGRNLCHFALAQSKQGLLIALTKGCEALEPLKEGACGVVGVEVDIRS